MIWLRVSVSGGREAYQDQADEGPGDALDEAGCPKFLQIFVFSATLTLPRNLRRRLKGDPAGLSRPCKGHSCLTGCRGHSWQAQLIEKQIALLP